mmetsp:Transcript_108891/g.325693  ORF Transcript_108891/g.325693 Transcript_108891/m.325693 type:complete len:213 (+) Transcript_108891:1502-2140(+)
MVALDVKFHHGADGELHALVLRQQAVSVNEEVARESVRVDEAPGSLEGAYVPVQSAPDPVTGPQQSTRRYLLCNRAAAVVQRHIELDRLPRAQRWLAVLELVWHGQEQVVTMYKEISIEGRGVEEAPTIGEAADVAAVALPQAVVGLPAHHRLHRHSVRAPALVGLHVELHALTLLELVVLALQHDALRLEGKFAFEQVAPHTAPAAAGDIL